MPFWSSSAAALGPDRRALAARPAPAGAGGRAGRGAVQTFVRRQGPRLRRLRRLDADARGEVDLQAQRRGAGAQVWAPCPPHPDPRAVLAATSSCSSASSSSTTGTTAPRTACAVLGHARGAPLAQLELTLAAALRLGWTGKLNGIGLFAPLVWLGFPPTAACGAGHQPALPVLAARALAAAPRAAGMGVQHAHPPQGAPRIEHRVPGLHPAVC